MIEEESILRRVLEESKQQANVDPTNPDVDNMTYEQLIEMADAAGAVNKGLNKEQID